MRKRQKPAVGLLSTEEELKTYLNPPKTQPIGLLDITYQRLQQQHKKIRGGLLDELTNSH